MLDHLFPALAQLAFFPFALIAFGRLDRATATVFVVLAGILFLPEIELFKLHDSVVLGKNRIVFLAALAGILVHQSRAFFRSKPVLTSAAILCPMLIINVISWQANLDAMFSQGAVRSGLSFSWLIGQTIDDIFTIVLPFVIAKAMILSYQDLRSLTYLLVGAGLLYTPLVLTELVMAIPYRVFQFSNYIYDIPVRPRFRYGLTEPVGFLGSGHRLATFMVLPFILAAVYKKIGIPVAWMRIKKARLIAAMGLLATLKLGSILLGVCAAMAIAVFKPRRLVLIASIGALAVCTYPLLQISDSFPEDALVELAAEYTNDDRTRSFAGRFEEEEFVIDGLDGRMYSGWGHFARIPGANTNIGTRSGEAGLDAWWVIKLGHSGILGVLFVLLVMAIPVWKARKLAATLQSNEIILLLGGVMLCIVVRMADLLLNGWWNSMPVFLAGALYAIVKHAHRLSIETAVPGNEPQFTPNPPYGVGDQTSRLDSTRPPSGLDSRQEQNSTPKV